MSPEDAAQSLTTLDQITRRLRVECPWDREQDERTIVPHTVEEAYELADAAHKRDDAKMLDELGDVLFQVHFLALLLEERGAGDLLFAVVNVARKLKVDPELALRSASKRFRDRVTTAGELAASEGGSWDDLPPEQQLAYYARARLTEGDVHQR